MPIFIALSTRPVQQTVGGFLFFFGTSYLSLFYNQRASITSQPPSQCRSGICGKHASHRPPKTAVLLHRHPRAREVPARPKNRPPSSPPIETSPHETFSTHPPMPTTTTTTNNNKKNQSKNDFFPPKKQHSSSKTSTPQTSTSISRL